MARRRIAIIVNTRSRRGAALFEAAREGLAARGFHVVAAYAVRNPAHFGRILHEAIAAGHDFIAVGGGDGTLASAASRLADRPLLMAILPFGTANSFARSLGIVPELDAALDVIAGGHVTLADVVRIGDQHFLNAATIGVPARIAQDIPPWLKRWFGRFGYLAYGIYKLFQLTPFEVRISISGKPDIVEKVVEVRIANGAYVGGAKVVDSASPESRDVVIQLVRGHYMAALASVWAANLVGLKPVRGKVRELRAAAFTLACTPEQPISVDGEAGLATPVLVAVAPGVLHLVAPPVADRE
jgi:YegS/Rv2252/BmrU family lipid kinase